MASYDGTPLPGTEVYDGRPCKNCGRTLKFRSHSGCVYCQHQGNRQHNRRRGLKHNPEQNWWLSNTALGRTNALLKACRRREKRRGVPLEGRLEVREWVGPVYYEICWGPFAPLFKAQIENAPRNGKPHPWSPSIDRLDQSIPTYANNFRVVPWRINQMAQVAELNGWPYEIQYFLDQTGIILPTEPLRPV